MTEMPACAHGVRDSPVTLPRPRRAVATVPPMNPDAPVTRKVGAMQSENPGRSPAYSSRDEVAERVFTMAQLQVDGSSPPLGISSCSDLLPGSSQRPKRNADPGP